MEIGSRFSLGGQPYSWFGKNFVSLESFDEIIVRSEEMKRELKIGAGLDSHAFLHGVDLNKFRPMDKAWFKPS
jgi:hypothetical protein